MQTSSSTCGLSRTWAIQKMALCLSSPFVWQTPRSTYTHAHTHAHTHTKMQNLAHTARLRMWTTHYAMPTQNSEKDEPDQMTTVLPASVRRAGQVCSPADRGERTIAVQPSPLPPTPSSPRDVWYVLQSQLPLGLPPLVWHWLRTAAFSARDDNMSLLRGQCHVVQHRTRSTWPPAAWDPPV